MGAVTFCQMFLLVFLIVSSFTTIALYHVLLLFVLGQLPCSLRHMLNEINLIGYKSGLENFCVCFFFKKKIHIVRIVDFNYLDDIGGSTHTINFLRNMSIPFITQGDRLKGIQESLRFSHFLILFLLTN